MRAEKPSADAILDRVRSGQPIRVVELRRVLESKGLPASENTVRRWIAEGKIEVKRSESGMVWIAAREVLSVLAWLLPAGSPS